ncbi:MAG: beta-ketoacyl synthase N-terminal-like domain-containing protein, partial [Puniceicoccales bacterium]
LQIEGRRLFCELPGVPNHLPETYLTGWDGLILAGSEAAGFSGVQSSLVTALHIPDLTLPVYLRGGISLESAAACRVAGAAGIIVEEAAWLLSDSPLDEPTQALLRPLNGDETRSLGTSRPLRVWVHPTFADKDSLEAVLEQEESGKLSSPDASSQILSRWTGWKSPDASVWPVGQTIGLASLYSSRYTNLSHLVQEIERQSLALPAIAGAKKQLDANGPLATSLNLRCGIVQGPMTRVSDVPAFADSISQGGAMPTLALALLNRERSLALLRDASELIGDRPWGVGILGFVPPELQEEQIEAILQYRPPFAIIAGGRPEQADRLEAAGITTFLHVPTPALLKIFLKQGARRFIFEGRECGGHVGPLSSFVLWSQMVETLLENAKEPSAVEILFAGGIHDALSTAMAATIAAPLLDKGFAWGVLMGTAYLFTRDAVEDGAITETFQDQALRCTETVCLPVAPGHANRCIQTQFADDFLALRKQLLAQKAPSGEIRAQLEEFTLGRLRVATKGLDRNPDGKTVHLPANDQLARGMFMIGETATLRHERTDIATLHEEIVSGSHRSLSGFTGSPRAEVLEAEPPVDVAVVGISTFLPDAADKDALWKNLLDRHIAVREIPKHRWDTRLHYDPDPDAPGKTNSKWGGFFPDVEVDLAQLGIPPASARHMSTSNLLCLEAARLALADAGYERRPFDRENTAVILANADGGGHLGHALIVRSLLGLFDPDIDPEVFERMPPIKEESLPGTLTNVVAGRISNRMDLGGPNYTVDAACASSLATIDLAARELNSRRSNVVLAGASEIVMGPPAFVAFSKVGALSGSGKVRPFDQSADGIALSDGIVFLVLKRLADAERDGDRIYSVIKGVGGSSDGKALGMTAPRPLGQKRALNRAYANAGYSPATIGFYEAHATGTPVGDSAELQTIIESLESEGAGPNSCVISSSKGVLGHSRTAAGMAALVKSILALHYKVLPPLPSVTKPLPGLDSPETPVNIRRTPHPWLHSGETPRRAGVSAFGFGGTNFHVALEEYSREPVERAPGGSRWPAEIVLLGGRDESELKANAQRWLAALAARPDLALPDIAFTASLGPTRKGFAAIVGTLEELRECLDSIEEKGFDASHRCLIARQEDFSDSGKIAYLFPGQASQNIDMAGEASLFLQPLREVLEKADALGESSLARKIYPPTAFSPERLREQRNQLARTEIAQPAIGAISLGFLGVLEQLGMQPDFTAGHSYGEIPALVAGGRLSVDAALKHSFLRGQAMSEAPAGSMAAVHSSPEEISSLLAGFPELVVANHNAPRQVVVAGPLEPLEALVEKLNSEGIRSSLLPVSGAFHSPLMETAREQWRPFLKDLAISPGSAPVYSAVTQDFYPEDPEKTRDLLLDQLIRPVSFTATINRLYEEGVRTFVEVGPRNILSNLTSQILKGRSHHCVVLDDEGKGLAGFLQSIASLWAEGRIVDFPKLF